MSSDGKVIKGNFNTKFVKNAELAERLYAVINEYRDQIPLAELVGVLEIVKLEIVAMHLEREE